MTARSLSIPEVEEIAFQLAKQLMEFEESIPAFDTRFPEILESCLATPFQKFGGRFLYPGLIHKSAILFYLMVKNHPFKNGNKRIAMMTLLYFLYIHRKWIEVDNQKLYNFARWVAESQPEVKDQTVAAITEFITKHLRAIN